MTDSNSVEDPTQGVAGRLIAELEAGGSEARAGAFTFDEGAARRKLAEYRLADPMMWACLLAEGARALGASWIRFTDHVIEFDGTPPNLEQLFAAAFGASDGAHARGRKKLAIALAVALEIDDVEEIRVTTAHGQLSFKGNDAATLDTSQTSPTTRIELRGYELDDELVLVRAHCRFAPFDVRIGDVRVSGGLRSALEELECRENSWPIMDGKRTIGLHGWHADEHLSDSRLILLCDGVVAEVLEFDGAGDTAIVNLPFRKDLGQSDILRDAEFERMLALVEAHRHRHARPVIEASPEAIAGPRKTPSSVPQLVYILSGFVMMGAMLFRSSAGSPSYAILLLVLVGAAIVVVALVWLREHRQRRSGR
jgi:hypothetical protein